MKTSRKLNWADLVAENADEELEPYIDVNAPANLPLGVGSPNRVPPPEIVRARQATMCHLEITMTHPHTTQWLNAKTDKQRNFFNKAWNECKNVVGFPHDSGYATEFHKNGLIHLHGWLVYHPKERYYIEGMILDYVRHYLRHCMPKKYNKINMNYFYPAQENYTSPQIKVSYHQADRGRLEYWQNYCKKCV